MPVDTSNSNERISSGLQTTVPKAYPLTICGTALRNAASAWYGVIQLGYDSGNAGWVVEFDDANHLFFENHLSTSVANSTGTLPAGDWFFWGISIAAALGSVTFYCYNYELRTEPINQSTGTAPALVDPGNEEVNLMAWESALDNFGDFWDGIMGWTAIYNVALTAAQLAAIAFNGPHSFSGLTNLWPLVDDVEGGTGTMAREVVSGINGTLTNFEFNASNGWRPIALPGLWRNRKAARVIRPQGGAPPTGWGHLLGQRRNRLAGV